MAEVEQQPLLPNEVGPGVDDVPSHPPPKYEPTIDDGPAPPKYVPAKPMPLPTYDQSEKYETEGVLEYEREQVQPLPPHHLQRVESEEEEERESGSFHDNRGSCCEFTIFFLLCAVFTLAGFVFSLCVASTVAAQSGAFAGLGVSLITQSIIFEVYGVESNADMFEAYCAMYYSSGGSDHVEKCVQRAFFLTRVSFWIVGLFGLYMLHKGLSNFCRTRVRRN